VNVHVFTYFKFEQFLSIEILLSAFISGTPSFSGWKF